MAVATTKVAILKGYTTPMGNRALAVADVTLVSPANASTYPAGGFAIAMKGLGLRGFDGNIGGGTISQGGNYVGLVQNKIGGNPQTVFLRLIVLATGIEVATGAAVTADTIRIAILGG